MMLILSGLYGCANKQQVGSSSSKHYSSPQALIIAKQLNQSSGQAKEYVYDWGNNKRNQIESLQPRQHLAQYCQDQGGQFGLAYKSHFSLIKEAKAKNNLSQSSSVNQGVGAYRCRFSSTPKNWLVSIEATGERREAGKRSVLLLTQLMTEAEAQRFYKTTAVANKKTVQTRTNNVETKVPTTSKIDDESKESANVQDTPQQQQSKLYVNARRDINSGKNLVNACNSAQRAYNYGKLQGTEGTRIYTESGMLVVRCLTQTSAYSSRFPNAKAQAKRILQNLAQNYNHVAAKNMLKQMK